MLLTPGADDPLEVIALPLLRYPEPEFLVVARFTEVPFLRFAGATLPPTGLLDRRLAGDTPKEEFTDAFMLPDNPPVRLKPDRRYPASLLRLYPAPAVPYVTKGYP